MQSLSLNGQAAADRGTRVFAEPVVDRFATMRALAAAMDNPGWIVGVQGVVRPPFPVNRASAAICIACVSPRARLWTDRANDLLTQRWFVENCGCSMVSDPEAADVALVTSLLKMPPLACFARPRRAARIMLIVQVCALTPFPLHAMPAGRAEARRSTVKGVSDRFWLSWSGLQHHGFEAPDLIFTCGDALSAAPGDGMVVNRL